MTSRSSPNSDTVLKIGVISDTHWGEADTEYASILPGLVKSLNLLDLDFVICNGDNIHDDATLIPAFVTEMNKLNVPWYWGWGNHDLTLVDGNRTAAEAQLDALGIEHTCPRYFTVKGHNIVIFDTGLGGGEFTAAMRSWFETTFTTNDLPMIVFMHHGIIADTVNTNPDKQTILDTFAPYGNVKAVYVGHDHNFNTKRLINGTWYVQGRRGGGSWGLKQGYLIIHAR